MGDLDQGAETGIGSFEPNVRGTLRFNATNLTAFRHLDRRDLPPKKPNFSGTVSGYATADTDEVCVIGTDNKTSKFSLSVASDASMAESWQTCRGELWKPKTPKELHLWTITRQKLDKNPPDIGLHYFDSSWSIECCVPNEVLEKLIQAVSKNPNLVLRITMSPMFGLAMWEQDFSDIMGKNTWGLYRFRSDFSEEEHVESLNGHLTYFSWQEKVEPGLSPSSPLPQELSSSPPIEKKNVEMIAAILRAGRLIFLGLVILAATIALR